MQSIQLVLHTRFCVLFVLQIENQANCDREVISLKRKQTAEQTEKTVYRPVRCSAQLDETISQIAERKHLSKSEVLRDLVYKGLEASGASIEEGYLYELIRKCVADELSPAVERLAAISAKATQISGAAFFMSIWAGSRNLDELERAEIQQAAEEARRLGIEWLKLKDRDLDAFLGEGAKKIMEADQ